MALQFGRALARGHVCHPALFGARVLGQRSVSVSTETTPNPMSLMFRPAECDVLGGRKTMVFKNKLDTQESPLASALFKVYGVGEVMLAPHHVTVSKTLDAEWEDLEPMIELVMSQFFAAGLRPLREGAAELATHSAPQFEEGTIEATIVELLEERVRPNVQEDGGDIEFESFDSETGKLYVKMRGACAGCPKASVTLKNGVQNLMIHFIPEVTEVLDIDAAAEEASEETSLDELEEDNESVFGMFRITQEGTIVNETSAKESAVIATLPLDTVVKVMEVVFLPEEDLMKGRIAEPMGWISLWNLSKTSRWAIQET